jgi:L-cysteine S-thiosulfotransferase
MKVYRTMVSKIVAVMGTLLVAANTWAQAPTPTVPSTAPAVAAPIVTPPPPINGREIFIDERKGNCAACHKAPNDTGIASQSNIGPALQAVKARFPDRTKLREAIWDYSKLKPTTIMPPYGKHRILTDAEIDALVIYLESI